MATSLPTDIDATYSDDGSLGRQLHQQHHDELHAYTNQHDSAADPHGDRAASVPRALIDAKGDLLVGTGADLLARLAAGSIGHVLTVDPAEAVGLKWAAPSGGASSFIGCLLRRTANQSIPGSTLTAISWDTELTDPGGMHSPTTNPERVTIASTGYYLLAAGGYWPPDAGGGQRRLYVQNGTTTINSADVLPDSTREQSVTLTTLGYFVAGEYVRVLAYQTSSSGSLNLASASSGMSGTWLAVVKVGS